MPIDNPIEKRGETFFLNLRFLLIVTVFVSNAMEPLIREMAVLQHLYVWIFSFHMPLFVLVTGYFARSNLAGAAGRKVLMQIGLQYVIFQSLYSALDSLLFHVEDIHRSFFAPYLLLWFLASHLCWRLLMLAMRHWSPARQIAVSVLAGVLVGYLQLDGVWFSISRTFVYLPYFVIGYHLSFGTLARFYSRRIKRAALAVSAALFAALAAFGGAIPFGWLLGSMTYAELGAGQWYAGLYRLGMYALQIAASAAFLGWVPFAETRLTDWGRRTLYVFLLHGLIVRFAVFSGVYEQITGPAGAGLVILCAVLLTIALAQPAVKRWLHPIMEPSVSWMITLQRAALRRTL